MTHTRKPHVTYIHAHTPHARTCTTCHIHTCTHTTCTHLTTCHIHTCTHRYLGAMVFNTICIFACIFPGVDKLKKDKKRIGYKHWFQNTLGLGLCEFGIRHAAEERKDWAARTVTKFLRRCGQLVSRTAAPSTVVPICRRVLRDRRQVRKRKSNAGRKKKRKRGPGRSKSTEVDPPPRKVCHHPNTNFPCTLTT